MMWYYFLLLEVESSAGRQSVVSFDWNGKCRKQSPSLLGSMPFLQYEYGSFFNWMQSIVIMLMQLYPLIFHFCPLNISTTCQYTLFHCLTLYFNVLCSTTNTIFQVRAHPQWILLLYHFGHDFPPNMSTETILIFVFPQLSTSISIALCNKS